jgi:ribose-phosphate pyrophosphokinase
MGKRLMARHLLSIQYVEAIVFAGSGNLPLARSIAELLGVSLAQRSITRFPDGELHVELEETVRDSNAYVVQPTGPPVDESLMELLFIGDACWRAGASQLTGVIPYFGYARQDRRAGGREAVGVRLVADLLATVGYHRIIAVDLHSTALEGVFGIPLEHLSAVGLLAAAVQGILPDNGVIVAPDLGAVKLAERYARILRLPMAIVHKTRISGEAVQVRGVVGDVRGRSPIVVDDMISTGGTIEAALRAVVAGGSAARGIVIATHALLVGPAVERLSRCPIERLIVTDSIERSAQVPLPMQVVSLAPLLGEAISRLHAGESLADLIVHE